MSPRKRERRYDLVGRVVMRDGFPIVEIPLDVVDVLGKRAMNMYKEINVEVMINGIPFYAPIRPVYVQALFYEPDEDPRITVCYSLYMYREMVDAIPTMRIGSRLKISMRHFPFPRQRRGFRIRPEWTDDPRLKQIAQEAKDAIRARRARERKPKPRARKKR